MSPEYHLVQTLSLISLLHLPLGILTFLWVYPKTETSRDFIFWGVIIWFLPVLGSIVALSRLRPATPPRKSKR